MSGAESLVFTLINSGVETCFTNPGTSEMHFVAALDRLPGIRCVLGLFEGVASGAADGYARIARKPAATLLHCGPGLANGLANFHNAKRARVPIVNIVGDMATYHRWFDAPLTADIEGWARPVSVWTRSSSSAASVGMDAAAAVQAARNASGIATLILPSDTSWGEGGIPATALPISPLPTTTPPRIAEIARVLRSGEPTALVVTGNALEVDGLAAAHRIAALTQTRLVAPTFNRLIQRGRGRYPIPLLPYVIDHAVAALSGIRHVVLVGAQEPAGFFAYPGKPSLIRPNDAIVHVLARPDEDAAGTLMALSNELGAPQFEPPGSQAPEPASGSVNSSSVAQTLAALIPENAIVVDESLSFGMSFYPGTHSAAPHDWLQLTGGAIGSGLPLATGAALAAPGRRVINLEGDGSALYTIQALWTQAREKLDITTVILSNRKYAILEMELAKVGANPGRTALDLFDLSSPSLDWLRLAGAMGVEAARAETLEQFADLLMVGNRQNGPFLIELVIP
ncbi:MAG: acetolactate synthase large subunit [Verrucomicrobia bacterium]|nr:acetolactate synthase large subunit [Verrucomicrobiota bacterium]